MSFESLLSLNLFFCFSLRSSDGRNLIVASSDGYCSVIYFEEGELGKIYEKESASMVKKTPKSSGKKSSNNTMKDNSVKSNITTFNIDDCAMDIDLVKCNIETIGNDPSEELNEEKSKKVMKNLAITSEVNDLQTIKKLNEDTEEIEDIKLVYEESINETIKTKAKITPPKVDVAPIVCHKTPRRVQLITLSSPKRLKKQ